MKYELKTDPVPFQAVWVGDKLYEIRKDDRGGYQVDDELVLRETESSGDMMRNPSPAGAAPMPLNYTGREVLCVVTHKLTGPIYGLQDGWCILGIRRMELRRRHTPKSGATWGAEQPKAPAVSDTVFECEQHVHTGGTAKATGPVVESDDGKGWYIRPPALLKPEVVYNREIPDEAKGRYVHVEYTDRTREMGYPNHLDWTRIRLYKPLSAKPPYDDVAGTAAPEPKNRRVGDNKSGDQVTYYSAFIDQPSKGGEPYDAECIDIINRLDMTFAEGEAFKSIWRCAADRVGEKKEGGNPFRDAEKVVYYGRQMIAREKRRKDGK